MNYLSNRNVVLNSFIVEYDIRHANINVSKYYNLYKDLKYLDTLDALPKKDREVQFGLLLRKNPDLSKSLEKAFNDIVNEFLSVNGLDLDIDVISVKKDAVYVLNKKVKQTTFGPVEFVDKNRYHAYMHLNKMEFYIGADKIDVKGIGESYKQHRDGILILIQELIEILETGRDAHEFLSELCYFYKSRQMDLNVYREFNSRSQYKCTIEDNLVYMDNISYEILDTSCDISYNYVNLILPLIRLLL